MKTTLYKVDVSGTIREWTIERISQNEFAMHHGVMGGSIQTKIEFVEEGKAGRTLDEQILSRMASRISKKRDMGYCNSIEKARENINLNSINMVKPMLAQKEIQVPKEFALQYKYDGNRCLITKQNGKVFAYSRNGKLINSIDHIIDSASHIPEGAILDGELYKHGVPLQTLRSWISRKQAESEGLEYMCYDIVSPLGYLGRYKSLLRLGLEGSITLARTLFLDETSLALEGLNSRLLDARKEGYEGLMIRDVKTPYEAGKRSKSLIKIKHFEDDEFRVINILRSSDDWGILVCETKTGKLFKVSAPGDINFKKHVLENKYDFIGKDVTVEYANLTKDGIPFHPIAIAFR